MFAIPRSWNRSLLRAAFASFAVLAIGCGEAEDPIDFVVPDANTILGVPDAGGSGSLGGASPEAGIPGVADSGTNLPRPDASTSAMDATVTPPMDAGDSAVVVADAGSDGSVSMDGSVGSDGGDAALGDSAVGDSAVGDGAVGDGAAGDAAVGDAALSDGSTSDAGPRADLGKGDGKDVVVIGDSWMYNTAPFVSALTGGGISPALQSATGQPYRNYAKQGTKMLGTGILFDPPIPNQWDQAVRADRDIKTVVMTGGGNDVILDEAMKRSCQQGGPECAMILVRVRDALQQLWARMAAGGVQDVVHIVYAKVAGDGVKDIDASNADLQRKCDAVPAPMRCHMLYTDSIVASKSDLVADEIHPRAAANTRIAKAVVDLMVQRGMRR